jgi:arabinofuranan 3-O-arabinosyltransferase
VSTILTSALALLRLGRCTRKALETTRTGRGCDQHPPRLLGILATWRLQAYGYTFAAAYAAFFIYVHWIRLWLVNGQGAPVYHDFTCAFVAGWLALHGQTAAIYSPMEFAKIQEALVGPEPELFSVWPYPPTYFLILAPLALLPYLAAFLIWDLLTLLACIAAVYLIVQQRPAIALVLASPFTAWNFLLGQSGFLTASLIGASLLLLDRRPVLAGVFIGCLTYKPQFGILLPVALAAANHWRAFASSASTSALLAGASIAAFGTGPWEAFPRELLAQAGVNLFVGPGQEGDSGQWGVVQTVYGLVRYLNGSAVLAWLAHGVTTFGTTATVWLVWRSSVRYALKAAALSAGVLIATPYAFAYDLAAIVIPVAFLARDQIFYGLLRGEQTIMVALFAAGLLIIPTIGRAPVGAVILLTLLALILRRALCGRGQSAIFSKQVAHVRGTPWS